MSAIAGLISSAQPGRGLERAACAMLAGQESPAPVEHTFSVLESESACFSATSVESLCSRDERIDGTKELILVGDLRLDNREQLCRELSVERDTTDAALVLESYLRWNDSCTNYLVGDFAFAIWDLTRHRCFLARDHFGVRPIIYFQSSDTFVFCSSVEGILNVLADRPAVSVERIIEFFFPLLEIYDGKSTFFSGVHRLEPGCRMSVKNGEPAVVERYYSLSRQPVLDIRCDEEYIERFAGIFTEAVGCRMGSYARSGVMLSGGLDSSAIAAMAARHSTRIRTFSALPHQVADKESASLLAVVRELGSHSSFVRLEDFEACAFTTEVLGDPDGLYDLNYGMLSSVFEAASLDGVEALLDGVCGNEVLGFDPAECVAHWLHSGRPLLALSELVSHLRAAPFKGLYLRRYLGRSLFGLFPEYAQKRSLSMLWKSHTESLKAVPLEISSELSEEIFEKKVRATELMRYSKGDPYDVRIKLLNSPLVSRALDSYHRISARHSVESVHPYIDKRVVEFALSLPLHFIQRSGFDRWILRKSVEGLLPAQIAWRQLDGIHYGYHFTKQAMKCDYSSSVSDSSGVLNSLIDRSKIERLLSDYENSTVSHAVPSDDFIANFRRDVFAAAWLSNHDH